MKHCSVCGLNKKLSAFTRQKERNGTFRPSSACKECSAKRATKFYARETIEQSLRRREKYFIRVYGITMQNYNDLFEKQQGKCLGCWKHQAEFEKSLAVDHCHTTGKVRGLLCNGCNIALGNAKENSTTLRNLAEYLETN